MTNQTNSFFEFNKELDAAFLNELFADEPSYVITVFEGFLEELPQGYEEMYKAISNKDVVALKSAAHKSKTLFAFAGLTKVSKHLSSLEAACDHTGDTKEVEFIYEELVKQRPFIETLITEEIKRLRAFYGK